MRWSERPVRVRVPATSANIGPGFDSLGLALGLHDTVEAQVTSAGLTIDVNGVGTAAAQLGERHLVVRAMRAAFEVVGERPSGLALSCHNEIPQGFGLGSSAGAIVGGLLAARALCGEQGAAGLPDQEVLRLAAELEGHADNVAACLAGGLTIAWTAGGGSVRYVRLAPLAGLTPVLCVPTVPLSTQEARAVLPATVPHADAANNAARAALLVAALTGAGERPEADVGAAGSAASGSAAATLLDATEDFLHQRYRADSMPGSAALLTDLRDAGIPAVVSGAGPAVLALIAPGVEPEVGPAAVAAITARSGEEWSVRTLDVDREGAVVTTVSS